MNVEIGIDPGECTGVGIGLGGRLVACYDSTPEGELVLPIEVTRAIKAGAKIRALIELPVLYYVPVYGHPSKATSIGNSLIRESVSLGEWKRQLRDLGAEIRETKPREWKGQAPKLAFCKRIVKLLAPEERRLVNALGLPTTKLHNVLDGIGLMLTEAGRLSI
jgi:hypothetical protein